MDANTISAFLSQNCETIQNFVKLMFEDCKRDIERLRNGNSKLRTENKELQNTIEFCHNQTIDLKKRIDELQSTFSTSHDADLGIRVKKLEDYPRKKNPPYKWQCRAGR